MCALDDFVGYISYVTYVINKTFIWGCDLISCHVLLPSTVSSLRQACSNCFSSMQTIVQADQLSSHTDKFMYIYIHINIDMTGRIKDHSIS